MEKEKDFPEASAEQVDKDNPQTGEEGVVDQADENADLSSVSKELPAEELQLMLEDARSKADEHWEMVIRARAETENLIKRQARELENAHKYAIDKFVSELLPVRDSMEMGLSASREQTADLAKIIEGTELTLKLLTDVMAKFGIKEINPEGQAFNPEYHQAMAMQPTNDVEPNTVITVIQKGYTLNDRLVRPAMVLVSQAAN
jgi:molecular chaperone GrpE